MDRIIIIVLSLIVSYLGVYSLHWLCNVKEWMVQYSTKSSKKSKNNKKMKPSKLFVKIISFLIKDKSSKVPASLYIIITSIFILSLTVLVYLISYWYSLD